MAKRKRTVKVETISKPKVIKGSFVKNGIVIPAGFKMNRAKFDDMFKGKIDFDINQFWNEYQDYLND